MPYTGGFPAGSQLYTARGRYDFSIDGGAVGDIELSVASIPAGAVIHGGYIEVDTALDSGGSATVALKVEGAADTLAATAFGSSPWSSTGRKSVVPAFTGATSLKTTAARKIVATVATAALTAGKFDVFLFYSVQGD